MHWIQSWEYRMKFDISVFRYYRWYSQAGLVKMLRVSPTKNGRQKVTPDPTAWLKGDLYWFYVCRYFFCFPVLFLSA